MIDRRGPEWDCTVPTWHLWQWQATMHLNGKGYKATLEGENKDDVTSGDAAVRDEYVRKNGDLFREILRMFNVKSEAGKTLMLQIQDEFDNDHDGYGLWEYLKAWASSLTPAEVKVLKKRVEALKFSASETPEKWSYKMQLLLNMWKRIPADKRGGTIADLSDTLLDKVGTSWLPQSGQRHHHGLRAPPPRSPSAPSRHRPPRSPPPWQQK